MLTVKVAAAGDVPAMLTDEVDRLTVGGYCPPAGPVLTAAVNETLPTNPCWGVIVMVDMFPLIAPAAIVTAVPVTVMNGLLELTTCTDDDVTGP